MPGPTSSSKFIVRVVPNHLGWEKKVIDILYVLFLQKEIKKGQKDNTKVVSKLKTELLEKKYGQDDGGKKDKVVCI